jgi:4-hydroxythreonine-4-phosphate dehydrogenase
MSGWIAICIGDITGIGPEVTMKALASELPSDQTKYLLLGDSKCLHRLKEQLRLSFPIEQFQSFKAPGRIYVESGVDELPANLPPGAPEASRAVMEWLRSGALRSLNGETKALVTAPVSKEAIIRSGFSNFVGQTEFLSGIAGTDRTVMMLLGADDRNRWLRVALATNHVALKGVPEALTKQKIINAVLLAAKACRDLQLPRARVGVCGLNPHAGEGGKIGSEEEMIILPALQEARAQTDADVVGPLPADTLFHYAFRGDYDAVVAMYHDQGLVPLKMIGFETGVNWTLGLPFIRTSPDHGTAYDIAGKGVATPSSMVAALRLAKKLAKDP